MSRYNYIHVTLSETISGEENILYNYPSDESVDAAAVFDGGAALGDFINLRECYSLWSSTLGHYFALITSASGQAMTLTVRLDADCALSGRKIASMLNELKKSLIENRILISESVDRALESAGVPEEPEKLESWAYRKPLTSVAAPTRPLCYRTYASSSELDAILSFPSQVEYECFDRVLVVQATASLRPGSHLDRITAQLKRRYTVIPPVGCTPDKTVVTDGERLTLRFTKAGFNPREENISVGAPSPYVRYEGSAIRVKTPAESGMSFVRRVPLEVHSSKGIKVQGYTINVNGRPINTMEPYIEITERDLAPNSRTEIQVASNNYRPLKVVKTPSDLVACEKVVLVLEPIEQGITLRLDFGDGRLFHQEITLEKNTPEYSQLHSGNFHGFRAHRITVAGNAEVYNVDMKSPVRPVVCQQAASTSATDTETPRIDMQPHRKPVAPVFDKDTPDDRRERRLRDKQRKEEARQRIEQAEDEKTQEAIEVYAQATDKRLWWLVGAIVVILGLGAWWFFSSTSTTAGDEMIVAEGGDAATVEPIGAATPAAAAASAAQSPDVVHDIAYLNDNKYTWRIDSLRTETYRALVTALAEGDIDAALSNPYFQNDADLKNSTARSIADMIWAAKGSPNEASNRNAMKKNVKDGEVSVWNMYEAVARVKPAEPNTAPRPVK